MKNLIKSICITVVVAISASVLLYSLVNIFFTQKNYYTANREYTALQQQFSPLNAQSNTSSDASTAQVISPNTPKTPQEINPDYVGWLVVHGTSVNYPVVQAANNEKYLTTTFEGYYNSVGAIFMDCHNKNGFAAPHTILYGHNVKNGSMFGTLSKYLDTDFLAENPDVTVTLPSGETHRYRIFAAYKSNSFSSAYQIGFSSDSEWENFASRLGAPAGTRSILTFSTCTNNEDQTERILVHAARV